MTGIKKFIFSPYLLLGIIILSLIASVPATAARHRAEQANRTAELLLPYGELLLEQQQRGTAAFTLPQALHTFGQAGIGGLLFVEQTLAELHRLGQLQYFEGAELLAAYRGGRGAGWINELGARGELLPGRFYLEIFDDTLWQRALYTFSYKSGELALHRSLSAVTGPDAGPGVFSLPGTGERWLTVGAGFPEEAIEEAAAAGFNIYLQLAYWPGASPESIAALLDPLGELPSVSGLLFRDAMLPGIPEHTPRLAALLDALQFPLVTIEFFDRQAPYLNNLVRSLEQKQVLRLHAISAEEMETLSAARIVQRFRLAVTERNNRLLLLRFRGEFLPGTAWLEENRHLYAALSAELHAAGFSPGRPQPFTPLPFSRLNILLPGAGIIAAAVLLLRCFGCAPAAAAAAGSAAFLLFAAFLSAAGGLAGIDSIELARKGLALGAAIIFPTLGVMLVKPNLGSRSLGTSILSFALLTVVSLAGAFLLAALLSDLLYLTKLDRFSGVKAALLLPPLVLLSYFAIYGITGAQGEGSGGGSAFPAGGYASHLAPASRTAALWQPLRRFLEQPLLVGSTLTALALLLLFYIYISRAGNESLFVGELELRLRLLLGDLLSVRPRTKEFLIGHPLMLLAFYYGSCFRGGPALLALGAIGQVSLVNSFAHLHTPLLITLIRTGWGLGLGILLGLALLTLLYLCSRPPGGGTPPREINVRTGRLW